MSSPRALGGQRRSCRPSTAVAVEGRAPRCSRRRPRSSPSRRTARCCTSRRAPPPVPSTLGGALRAPAPSSSTRCLSERGESRWNDWARSWMVRPRRFRRSAVPERFFKPAGHALHHQAHLAQRHHHLVRSGVLLLGGERDLARHPRRCRPRPGAARRSRTAAARERSSTRAASLLPSSVATMVARIELENSSSRLRTDSTDSCERWARWRTSSATTEKRRPSAPGRRGLDRGVERQDVGLLGDLGDQVEHPVDLLRAGAERVGAVGDGADPLLHLLDAGDRLVDRRRAGVAARLGPRGELGLARGVLGDLRGGARQLLHGGGDLDHRGRLLATSPRRARRRPG